jgi:translation initiation factor IF-3
MKYRPKISGGDFETKTRKVEKFLEEGHKVKVTLTFRGREMNHPELGQRILDRVVESVEQIGRVEIFPRRDGRNMTMVLAPDRKAQAATERARRQASEPGDDAPSDNEQPSTNGTQAPAPAAQAQPAATPAPAQPPSAGRPQPSQPPQGSRPPQASPPGPATRPAERT